MEDGQDLTNRVFFVELQDQSEAYTVPQVKARKVNTENQILKQSWTDKFLENRGLNYVVTGFFDKCDEASTEVKFLLSILTVYI
jgi:hypothetical protein